MRTVVIGSLPLIQTFKTALIKEEYCRHLTLRQSLNRLVKGVSLKRNIALTSLNALTWAKEKVPSGIRTLLGILLMIAGVLGFLPILGFWMFPLGMAFIALDLPFTQKRIEDFIAKLQAIVKETKEM